LIVDLAAEGGGNCTLAQPGNTVIHGGVKICAPLNLPSQMPMHASLLYARNLAAFLLAFCENGAFKLNLEDDIIKAATVTHEGQVLHAGARAALETPGPAA
jgi:NAD(P) transhydrogenase subunit alpha